MILYSIACHKFVGVACPWSEFPKVGNVCLIVLYSIASHKFVGVACPWSEFPKVCNVYHLKYASYTQSRHQLLFNSWFAFISLDLLWFCTSTNLTWQMHCIATLTYILGLGFGSGHGVSLLWVERSSTLRLLIVCLSVFFTVDIVASSWQLLEVVSQVNVSSKFWCLLVKWRGRTPPNWLFGAFPPCD